MAGASFSTGFNANAGVPKPPPKPTGPPVAQPKSSRPAPPIQVKAHTRAAPKPARSQTAAAAADPLLTQAQALANLQTQDPISELQKQIAANNAQTQGTVKLTGGFYNQLEPYVQQGVSQQGQIASGLNSQLAGIGQGTQSALQGIGQNAISSLSKYAPGDDANAATADLAAQIARQQGLAAQQSGTSQAFGAMQGANYQGNAASNLGTFGLQGQEALRGIAQSGTVKNQPLVSKIAGLQAQKGALTATDLGKLQQQQTANKIAEAGLGLKQNALNTTAQNDQANQALKAAGIKTTAQNNRANQALKAASIKNTASNDAASQALHAAQLNEKAGNDAANQALKQAALNLKASQGGVGKGIASGAKPLTTSQQNTLYRNLGEMVTLIGSAQKQKESESTIRQALQTGAIQKGFPAQSQILVQAAYELKGWGHITPQTANAMRSMGLRAGTYNGRPIKVAPPPSGVAKTVGQTGSTGALGSL